MLNEKGLVKVLPLLLIVAAVGILSFLLISSAAPLNGLFGQLNPKPTSHAASTPPDCSSLGVASLQTQINNTPSGGTLRLTQNCIYRESPTINKPMVLDGGGAAEVRGSDIWTSWSQSGNTWISGQGVPNNGQDDTNYGDIGDCLNGNIACLFGEQVFIDGVAQKLVMNNNNGSPQTATPGAGQFSMNLSTRQIILGSSPVGHVVEVSVRPTWVNVNADNITVQNFTMRHAGTYFFISTLSTNSHHNISFINNTLSDTTAAALGYGGLTDGVPSTTLIKGNTVYNTGFVGLAGYNDQTDTALIQGNTFYNSNQFDFYFQDWAAGGIKVAAMTNSIFDSNIVHDNKGAGIWCDIDCKNITFSNNIIYSNRANGIHFEISDGSKIFGNKVWNSGNNGIYISTSSNSEVYNNISAWNGDSAISVGGWRRGDAPSGCCVNNFVHDNTLFQTPSENQGKVLYFADSYGDLTAQGNHGSNNHFYSSTGGDGQVVFVWGNNGPDIVYNTLGSFNGIAGGGGNSNYINSTALLTQNNIPTCPNCSAPTPTPTVSSTPGVESPFNGPHTLPGTVQAEDYDNGGPGVSYNDVDGGNNGGVYRAQDVDIKATNDSGGGNAVGWIQRGEWMKYTVNVTTAGRYNFGARICASLTDGQTRTLSLAADGSNIGSFSVPVTAAGPNSDYCTFQTVNLNSVQLSAGSHILTFTSTGADWIDFNWFSVTAAATPTPTATPNSTCQGADIDHNGKVDIFDYNTLIGNFGKSGTGLQGDIDGNGTVNIFDYNLIVSNFGKTGC
jgi:parallel beta-helix repeat protein